MGMLKTIILAAIVAALTALLTPSEAAAYGAAHYGYTHVGPNGAYHTSGTAAYGAGGVYAGGRSEAVGYGGGAYRGGGGAAAGYGLEKGVYGQGAGYGYGGTHVYSPS